MRPRPRPRPMTDGPASFLWGSGAHGFFPPQCLCTGWSLHCRPPSTWALRATVADTHSKAALPGRLQFRLSAAWCSFHFLTVPNICCLPCSPPARMHLFCAQLPQAFSGPQKLAKGRAALPDPRKGSWAESPLGSLLWSALGRALFSSLGLPPSLPGWLGCSPGPLPGPGGTGRAGTHTVSSAPTWALIAGA